MSRSLFLLVFVFASAVVCAPLQPSHFTTSNPQVTAGLHGTVDVVPVSNESGGEGGEHELDAYEHGGCFATKENAIHCIHKFHIAIDSPHMWHDVHHLKHALEHKASLTEARALYVEKMKAVKGSLTELAKAEKIVAMRTMLETTLENAQKSLTKLKSQAGAVAADKAARLSARIATLRSTLDSNLKAKNFKAAGDYIIKAARTLESTRVAFMVKLAPVLNAIRSGANAARVAAAMRTAAPLLKAVAVPAAGAGAKVLKVITSEGFGKAVIVVAAVLEGAQKWDNTNAQTTAGKVANTVLAAAGAALVMANPWIALADVALGFIPGGEKWKPSKLVQCTGDALVAIAEGVITKDTTMLSKVDADMKSGKCGIILQMANAAGEYWAKMGFVGGMQQFFDDMAFAYDMWSGSFDNMWQGAFNNFRQKLNNLRSSVGDISPELKRSPEHNPAKYFGIAGTYINIKGCTSFPKTQYGDTPEPYFSCAPSPCREGSPGCTARNTEVPDGKQGNLNTYDTRAGHFGMFFRNHADQTVKCSLRYRWRLMEKEGHRAGLDETFDDSYFKLTPQFANQGVSKWHPIQMQGPRSATCEVMYVADMAKVSKV